MNKSDHIANKEIYFDNLISVVSNLLINTNTKNDSNKYTPQAIFDLSYNITKDAFSNLGVILVS